MTQNGPEHHDVPRDPALKEAFEAFIQQTQLPEDFHTRVLERVQQQRARHAQGKRKSRALSPLEVQMRMAEVLELYQRERSIRQISKALGIGYSTAWNYVQRIKAGRLNSDSD
jgi:hypothetical protein